MKSVIVLFLFPLCVVAQHFDAEAPLPAVEKNGFYNIPLSPGVTAWLEPDFRNVRIVDGNGKEVPYVIRTEQPTFSNVEFIEYEIEKSQVRNCCTVITILNKEKKQLNNIIFEVKNAEVLKSATLRGSDDKQSWYALKDEFVLGNFSDDRKTSQLSILDFPLSNYGFYQIVINDSTSAPLNILKAGYYNTNIDYGVYVEVPNVRIAQADSSKERATYVEILFDTTHFIDRIEFDVSGPQFYKRRAILGNRSFEIVSTHQPSIATSSKASKLTVYVRNDNNPPLKFNGVRVSQLRRSLTAWLESGQDYKLVFGSGLESPVYDLEFFRDSIPAHPPVLQLGELKKNVRAAEATTPTFFTNRNIIWLAIALVVIILGFMSVKMIRENSNG